jgi:SAM-dependent methyltransferase
MPTLAPDIYATPQIGKLLADEARVLSPLLTRCTGEHGLHLTASLQADPPALPLLGHWATVRVAGAHLGGDVRASGLEALPFADDAFGVVLLRHALETTARQDNLLDEAIRVLAPVVALGGSPGPWHPPAPDLALVVEPAPGSRRFRAVHAATAGQRLAASRRLAGGRIHGRWRIHADSAQKTSGSGTLAPPHRGGRGTHARLARFWRPSQRT